MSQTETLITTMVTFVKTGHFQIMSNFPTQNDGSPKWSWVQDILFWVKTFVNFWKCQVLTKVNIVVIITSPWLITHSLRTQSTYYKTRSEVKTYYCTGCCLTLTGLLLDISLIIQGCSTVYYSIWPRNHTSHKIFYFNEFVANVLRDVIGIFIFDLRGHGGC